MDRFDRERIYGSPNPKYDIPMAIGLAIFFIVCLIAVIT